MGFGVDLQHTNFAEAIHSSYSRQMGTDRDIRLVVVKLLQMAEDQKQSIALALVDQGPYRLRPAFQRLRIPQNRERDMTFVKQQQTLLFQCDPGDTVLTRGNAKLTLPTTMLPVSTSSTLSFPPFPKNLHAVFQPMWQKAQNILDNLRFTISPWPKPLVVNDTRFADLHRMVLSGNPGRKSEYYHVSLSSTTGYACCTCVSYLQMRLCKHTVAVAVLEDLIALVVHWRGTAVSQPTSTLYTSRYSGKKPGQSNRSSKRGAGHTKRADLYRSPLPDVNRWLDSSGQSKPEPGKCTGGTNISSASVQLSCNILLLNAVWVTN